MNGLATSHDVERFRAAIQQRLGLQFEDAKTGFLGEVLQRRSEKLGRSSEDYLREFESGTALGEIGPLAQELTVTETYFFRNIDQFHAFRQIVLPERSRAREASRALRFLSAATASGEEAYTIAMIVAEAVADPSWTVSIRAADINPEALAKARRARYAPWALRETPADAQRKWFRAEGREMVLDESVRSAVTFEARNLATDDPDLWIPGFYDAIFCRNAIMYFAPEQAHRVIARIARALAPGGYLFLGHAETLRGISDAFHLRHTHGTFYYQRKGGADGAASTTERSYPENVRAGASVDAQATSFADTWVDTIRQASERIEALVRAPVTLPSPSPVPSPAWDLAGIFDLLRSERFTDALTTVQQLPSGADEDADVLLLKAMLLTHSGEYAEAMEVCQRLIAIEDLNAGAHYVLALCCEGLGDRTAAAEHDRVAIYLDAAFAMPRLHMGLLARRAGDRELAQRELSRALSLLKHEDASRLLLFGGGFNRQALIVLCESALRDCGGQP